MAPNALSIIALFILIIAWVNYINLATAKSFERANEVGVRKVMGAQKNQLMNQFLAESLLVNLLAAIISIVAVWLIWPFFANVSGRNIPLAYLGQPDFWLLLGALFFVGTILSGFYPALVLSSFKPVAVLKGKVMHTVQGNFLRKSLVVFQFVASVGFISGSVIVSQQLKFMRSQDLGIDINQTLVVKGPGVVIDSLFKQNLEGMKTEALLVNLLAAIISVVAVWLIWPFFANVSGRNIPLAYLGQPDFWKSARPSSRTADLQSGGALPEAIP